MEAYAGTLRAFASALRAFAGWLRTPNGAAETAVLKARSKRVALSA